jgi:hypothetical protein
MKDLSSSSSSYDSSSSATDGSAGSADDSSNPPSKNPTTKSNQQQQEQHQEDRNDHSSSPSSRNARSSNLVYVVISWVGSMIRCILIDLPLLLLFLLWVSTIVLIHVHDEYFDRQLQLMTFIAASRDFTDTTYYHRRCDEDDITTTNVEDLIIPPDYTAQQCVDHMLLHGASLYPNLVSDQTAAELREFIDRENKVQEGWFVIKNEHRYSWGIDVNMHPALHTFWKELASNTQLVQALEAIVGPDPAIIEFTAITSSYGAVDQHDHSDVISPGSAAKFGRTFVPSYSLFIPLQNVTYDMGATHVCPGTHLCSEGGPRVCPRNHNNVALSGGKGHNDPTRNDGVWQCGAGALVNQQTTHKGMGYTLKNGPDRVVIIATFAPRPRFASGLETRMIGQGGSYSILWTQNGHTFSDFANAEKRMTEPQKTLRSLGLIKGNGWNWPTVSSMRIANEDNGFDQGPLDEFIDGGGFWFLPSSWQELDYEAFSESNDLLPWHAFLLGTVIRTSRELARINWMLLGVYLWVLLVCDLCLSFVVGPRRSSNLVRGSLTLRGIFRIGMTHGVVVALAWFSLFHIKSTNWARNLKAGRSFQLPYPPELVAETKLVKSTIPYRTDILMAPHYSSSYLASYAKVVDGNHPGNRYWKETTRNFGPTYSNFLPTLQRELCASLIESIRSDRRFLKQDMERYWGNVDGRDELVYFCHREMFIESSPKVKSILNTIDDLRVETQYGQLRDTVMHSTTIPDLLDDLEKMILPPVPVKTTNSEATLRLSHTWIPKSSLRGLPRVLRSISYHRKYFLPPIPPPREPIEGAWLQEDDIVEVKYQCSFNGT